MTKKQILRAFEKVGCNLVYKKEEIESSYGFIGTDGKKHKVKVIGRAKDSYFGISIDFYDGLVAIYVNTYKGRENVAFCPYGKIKTIEYRESDYDYAFILNGTCEF